jgi:hypothetical protein
MYSGRSYRTIQGLAYGRMLLRACDLPDRTNKLKEASQLLQNIDSKAVSQTSGDNTVDAAIALGHQPVDSGCRRSRIASTGASLPWVWAWIPAASLQLWGLPGPNECK